MYVLCYPTPPRIARARADPRGILTPPPPGGDFGYVNAKPCILGYPIDDVNL